jgi:Cof subfamily protein (haloacid dehalogenase superfamily)
MQYKLVALDLDGTLLNSEGKLPEKHIQAVKKAQQSGIHVVIATGRYWMQTEWIIRKLGFKGILVSNDGAVNINTDTKQTIHEFSYTVNDLKAIIDHCRQNGIYFSVCTAFEFFVELMHEGQEEDLRKYEIVHTFHHDVMQLKENVMKFTVWDKYMKNGWQDIPLPNLKIKIDNPHFKEYIHPLANKANGLKQVLCQLQIDPSEVIAIGDFYNDLEMFELAGFSIAMGNAPDDVKERADDTTSSNDEDGVYFALEKHL